MIGFAGIGNDIYSDVADSLFSESDRFKLERVFNVRRCED